MGCRDLGQPGWAGSEREPLPAPAGGGISTLLHLSGIVDDYVMDGRVITEITNGDGRLQQTAEAGAHGGQVDHSELGAELTACRGLLTKASALAATAH